MAGPFSIEMIEREIYKLVVRSKARQGQAFPTQYVRIHMDRLGYAHDDFVQGVDSLQERGLITTDEKISDEFFDALGSE